MTKRFEEVARVPFCFEEGRKYQIEAQGNQILVSREVEEPEWKDITKSCYLEFRDSQHSDGRYIAIIHKDKVEHVAAVIGIKGIVTQHGYRIERAECASVSFNVYVRVK